LHFSSLLPPTTCKASTNGGRWSIASIISISLETEARPASQAKVSPYRTDCPLSLVYLFRKCVGHPAETVLLADMFALCRQNNVGIHQRQQQTATSADSYTWTGCYVGRQHYIGRQLRGQTATWTDCYVGGHHYV
jgi:hypothetical protein